MRRRKGGCKRCTKCSPLLIGTLHHPSTQTIGLLPSRVVKQKLCLFSQPSEREQMLSAQKEKQVFLRYMIFHPANRPISFPSAFVALFGSAPLCGTARSVANCAPFAGVLDMPLAA